MIAVLVLRMDKDFSESESACTYFILKELYIQKYGNWKKDAAEYIFYHTSMKKVMGMTRKMWEKPKW